MAAITVALVVWASSSHCFAHPFLLASPRSATGRRHGRSCHSSYNAVCVRCQELPSQQGPKRHETSATLLQPRLRYWKGLSCLLPLCVVVSLAAAVLTFSKVSPNHPVSFRVSRREGAWSHPKHIKTLKLLKRVRLVPQNLQVVRKNERMRLPL